VNGKRLSWITSVLPVYYAGFKRGETAMMHYFLNRLGLPKVILIVFLVILLTAFNFVQMASATVWGQGLRFFTQWLATRILNELVNRYVYKFGIIGEELSEETIQELKKEISEELEQEISEKLKEQIKIQIKQRLSEIDREKSKTKKKGYRSIPIQLHNEEELMRELLQDIETLEVSYKDLLDRYNSLLHKWIEPIGVEISEMKIRIDTLNKILDDLTEIVKSLKMQLKWLEVEVDRHKKERDIADSKINELELKLSTLEITYKGLEHNWEALRPLLDRVFKEIKDIRESIRALRSYFRIRPVLGYSYLAFRFSNGALNERYTSLPLKAEPRRPFVGIQLSLGLWSLHTFYFEGSIHYLAGDSERIPIDNVRWYRVGIEGVGWSGTGVLTYPLSKNVFLEGGGGWRWTEYKVSTRKMPKEFEIGLTAANGIRKRQSDPLAVVGLRIGREGLSLLTRVECLVRDRTIKGYYIRIGCQWIP
jgi:hypothetical protein